MKTNIEVTTLNRALSLAVKPVARRQTLPILENALLHHYGDSLEIVTTDLDNTLSVIVPSARPPWPMPGSFSPRVPHFSTVNIYPAPDHKPGFSNPSA